MQPKSILNHCADIDMDTALLTLLLASTGTRAPALWLAQGNQRYASRTELSFSQHSSAHGRELGSTPGLRLLSQSRVQAQNGQPRSPRSGSGSRSRTSCFPNTCPSCGSAPDGAPDEMLEHQSRRGETSLQLQGSLCVATGVCSQSLSF